MFMVKVKLKESFCGDFTENDYIFKCYDNTIEENDIVLVDTQYGIAVGKVTEISLFNKKCTREVICKCDTTAYELRKKLQEEAKVLKEKMEQKVEKLQEIAMYEMLAANDTELKSMLDEYKEISKELEDI